MLISLLLLSAPAIAAHEDEIVITASRIPQEQEQTTAKTTVIDRRRIERLGEPLAPALVRLTPSAAVETGGPAGTLSQVRIRGAEANHTLLFIDGIRANDPAAGGIPRFELLNADIASRIEVVRGPQSALWGSDAIGGVVSVNGVAAEASGQQAGAEAGSLGFGRLGISGAHASADLNLAGALGWQRAAGIDSFSGNGDRDGYRNLAARIRGSWAFTQGFEIGASGFSLNGRSQFDGFNPAPPFQRMDTRDNSRNRLAAGRLWLSGGNADNGLRGSVAASLLRSSNRNYLGAEEINRTSGNRRTLSGQVQYRFATGAARHTAILAADHEREEFHARDTIYFGASNQDRHRSHEAITAEWRTELAPIIADVAVRHDRFSAFPDTTTVRLSALLVLGNGLSAAGSYSEGVAQPTFFDLHGFFPTTFVGNPSLKAESSRGFEASLRYRHGQLEAALTGYRQRLKDEIVDQFDPATFLSTAVNRDSLSYRSGLEAEVAWSRSSAMRLTANYAYLRASEPTSGGGSRLREIRRPKHSGSIAVDGEIGRAAYGASLAYVGGRSDTDVEVFPTERVRLRPYWLAAARIAFAVRPGVEITVRGSNLLDERYQDVLGYRTEGRAIFAGLRLSGR